MRPNRARNAAPHDRRFEAERPQHLRHLGDVPEAVGEVPDAHRAAKVLGACEPDLEIPHDRLAADEELVDERLPRPDREPPVADKTADPFLGLRSNLEVVVDRCQLSVEREAHALVGREQFEHFVDDIDQRDSKRLERPVPLAVPVRVRDEED